MAAEDISLMVEKIGSDDKSAFLKFKMELDRRWVTDPPFSTGSSESLEKTRNDVNKEIKNVMDRIDNARKAHKPLPGSFMPYLQGVGSKVFRNILPPYIQEGLAKAVGTKTASNDDLPILRIHLYPNLDWIPWEIMWCDKIKDFLGMRFQIARIPVMSISDGPDLSDRDPHQVHLIYNILGNNVADDSGFSITQWQNTFADVIMPPMIERSYPSINDPSWPLLEQVKGALEEVEADILHFTCHGHFTDEQEVYWVLTEEEGVPEFHEIHPSYIEGFDLRYAKPLVFGNACASAGQHSLTPGFGVVFFKKGAVAFVGTSARITKHIAFGFPREFYKQLLHEGLPIGKALWKTKQTYLKDKDPSWMFYCLYGPPETRFQLPDSIVAESHVGDKLMHSELNALQEKGVVG